MSYLNKIKVYKIMGIDPLTMKYYERKEQVTTEEPMEFVNSEDHLRLKVLGMVNGFAVEVSLYDSDFQRDLNIENLIPVDIAAFPFAIEVVSNYGVAPRTFNKPDSNNRPATDAEVNEKWKCPQHGTNLIKPNPFSKGKVKCGIFEKVTDLQNRPDWASGKPGQFKDGTYVWNCKYQEQ